MCDDITSGASNDLERATKMAREMVTRLGMSEELGTQVFGEAQHQVFLGRDYADHQDYSEETARRIDIEVQRIMREAHRRAVEILDARRDQLDLMAKVLLERETVEGDAVNALLDNEWDAYLEREGDILAAKEERNAKAAGMPTKKRLPRMSEEELAADARGLCARRPCRRMPKPHPMMPVMAMLPTLTATPTPTNSSCSESLCRETCGGFSFERYVDWVC